MQEGWNQDPFLLFAENLKNPSISRSRLRSRRKILKEILEEHDRLGDHSTALPPVQLETFASSTCVETEPELMQVDPPLTDESMEQPHLQLTLPEHQKLEAPTAGPSTSTLVTTFLSPAERQSTPFIQTSDQCDQTPDDCKTCDNLKKENKDLKTEIRSLKAKVTRLNRMALNQNQWVEMFQNQTEQDQQDFTPTHFGTPTEVEPTPIPEQSGHLDDYDDAEESDQGAPIYDEDPNWTPEDIDEAYIKLGDDCDDNKQTNKQQILGWALQRKDMLHSQP
ncbi:uncharacterized protein [Montipora capricornis]|uniref:uncharacterized protein isoform X2 n=1 Tax=Montipora capricornis TaxID=246305 RepID=UPI0035F211DA